MTKEQCIAVGNFIYTYYTDLNYIRNFQDFKRGKISTSDYIAKGEGTFYTFLVEFRIIRNVEKGYVGKLLSETMNWIKGDNADDVDKFAVHLMKKGLTRGNTMRSLASKVLFLNNPSSIVPMDTLTRNSLGQVRNDYAAYIVKFNQYCKSDKANIDHLLKLTESFTSAIETEYRRDIKKLAAIRKNRIADKLLWAAGRNR